MEFLFFSSIKSLLQAVQMGGSLQPQRRPTPLPLPFCFRPSLRCSQEKRTTVSINTYAASDHSCTLCALPCPPPHHTHLPQNIPDTARQKGAEHCNNNTVSVGATSAAATIIGTRCSMSRIAIIANRHTGKPSILAAPPPRPLPPPPNENFARRSTTVPTAAA